MIKSLVLVAAGTTIPCREGERIRLLSIFAQITAGALLDVYNIRIIKQGQVFGFFPINAGEGPATLTAAIGLTQSAPFFDPVTIAVTINPALTTPIPDVWFTEEIVIVVECLVGAATFAGSVFYDQEAF